MPKNSAYGAKGSKDSYDGQRGNVSTGPGPRSGGGGSKGGEQFFRNRTMQNTEGVMKKSTIKRNQPS